MANLELTYDFEELQLPAYGLGATFNGMATLIDCGDTFRVRDIHLGWRDRNGRWKDGPYTLAHCPQDGPRTAEQHDFKRIADVIEADEQARAKWDAAWIEFCYDRSEPPVYNALAAE